MTQACLLAALTLLLPLGDSATATPVVLGTLIALGALIGPVQPINAELAVEVAYPADENSIEALQQLCGNLFSALLVPVAERAGKAHVSLPGGLGDLRGDSLLLGGLTAAALAFFSGFDPSLKRSALDCAVGPEVGGCDAVGGLSPEDTAELEKEIALLGGDDAEPALVREVGADVGADASTSQ